MGPQSEVARILGRAEEKHALEQQWEKQITGGTWDRTWVDQALAKL
ncbi:hypothetical protein [Ramlibacter sp.]|nr:hypothetical protein [Ramlibacter sp.]